MTPALKLIVFDVDGTLVDSQHVIVASMQGAFESHGLPAPAADAVRRIVGLPLVEGIARLAPELDPLQHEALSDAYRDGFLMARQRGVSEALFPGVREMLGAVAAAGYVLGVATGKSMRGLRAMLERHDLVALFDTLQTGDEPPGKPDPAMLLRAVAEAGVEPGETAMIGDTTFDIEMARAAGALPVGVRWGYHPEAELRAAGAAHLMDETADIPRLLARLALGRTGA